MGRARPSIWSAVSPSEHLPAARHALFTALDENQLPWPETVAEWRRAIHFLVGGKRHQMGADEGSDPV